MSDFPYSETEVIDFLRQRAPELLARLPPGRLPHWGRPTAPQVVAHLTEWVGRSAGLDSLAVPPPAAYFAPARQWLVMHFKHHFMPFGLLPDSLLPHRRPHLLLPGSPADLQSLPA